MTISALKHISYSAAGGLSAGWMAGVGLVSTVGSKMTIGQTALALAVTTAVARTFDELLKASGWTDHTFLRLTASHCITFIAILPAVSVVVGYPVAAARLTAGAITVCSLAVNILVK